MNDKYFNTSRQKGLISYNQFVKEEIFPLKKYLYSMSIKFNKNMQRQAKKLNPLHFVHFFIETSALQLQHYKTILSGLLGPY